MNSLPSALVLAIRQHRVHLVPWRCLMEGLSPRSAALCADAKTSRILYGNWGIASASGALSFWGVSKHLSR